jgi:hypothetical protein
MKPSKKAEIVQITKVRMQKELKDKLTRSADRNNRTQNGELVHRLEQSFLKEETELREGAYKDLLAALVPQRTGPDGTTEIDATELAKRLAGLLDASRDSNLGRYLADYQPKQPRRRGPATEQKPTTERDE